MQDATAMPVVLWVGSGPPTLTADQETPYAGFRAEIARSQAQAVAMMFELSPAVVLIDLGLSDGSPLAVADFANYRHPEARVIFMSDSAMFSDGSLFNHCTNVHAHVARGMSEPDMVALVSHHAEAGGGRRPG
ncbi:hypothetical protein JANAI62_06860 [Jannaschia pagri]|uniref:Response regulator receiver domain-containing protein n=1 Tax=Jannaschia pagri TaxID=2829797 RepID=A0ABQ4NI00_9RHOB|nr:MULTISPECIES: hypothetical protein [unclassified Jannaschia]GIT89830.1 hypothetical protein JANAI61_02880 [Jannaschia sp. AI_61]GIT94063.1 hypothetical protein JANAI62_06860 [Jannaschia sp. AI_62]